MATTDGYLQELAKIAADFSQKEWSYDQEEQVGDFLCSLVEDYSDEQSIFAECERKNAAGTLLETNCCGAIRRAFSSFAARFEVDLRSEALCWRSGLQILVDDFRTSPEHKSLKKQLTESHEVMDLEEEIKYSEASESFGDPPKYLPESLSWLLSTDINFFNTAAHIPTLFVVAGAAKDYDFIMTFGAALLTTMRSKGMEIDSVAYDSVTPQKIEEWLITNIVKGTGRSMHKKHQSVLLYIESGSHNRELKMYERLHGVPIQHFSMNAARKIMKKEKTFSNLLFSLNMKGGGQNRIVRAEGFSLELWRNMQTMIIAYDLWRPSEKKKDPSEEEPEDTIEEPEVIGFSFNGGVNADSFLGDYHYQQVPKNTTRRTVKREILDRRVKWMLSEFEGHRRCLPPLIIVFRDGASTTRTRDLESEVSLLKKGVREYAASRMKPDVGYDPKFILLKTTLHKANYKPNEKEQHDAAIPVFYPRKRNMGKPVKYSVVLNEVDAPIIDLRRFIGSLSVIHQVSGKPMWIPEPIFQADEWTKTGASNMRLYKGKEGLTFEQLTRQLAYWRDEEQPEDTHDTQSDKPAQSEDIDTKLERLSLASESGKRST